MQTWLFIIALFFDGGLLNIAIIKVELIILLIFSFHFNLINISEAIKSNHAKTQNQIICLFSSFINIQHFPNNAQSTTFNPSFTKSILVKQENIFQTLSFEIILVIKLHFLFLFFGSWRVKGSWEMTINDCFGLSSIKNPPLQKFWFFWRNLSIPIKSFLN